MPPAAERRSKREGATAVSQSAHGRGDRSLDRGGLRGRRPGRCVRRVQVRRYKARAAVRGRPIDSISGRESWDLRKTLSKPAVKARIEYDIGAVALHPGSIGPIFRSIIQRAFELGALPDLTAEDLARLLKGVSAHSTRMGLKPGPVREW